MTLSSPRTASIFTPAEYLAWERLQPDKHEFEDGLIVAMAGGSLRHALLASRMIAELSSAMRGTGCNALTSDMRVGVRGSRYYYPDVTVLCGVAELELGSVDVLVNPAALVEVLSKSTEARDRGSKFRAYGRLRSLRDYLLVAQSSVCIEHFQRSSADQHTWTFARYEAGEELSLADGTLVRVDEIYDGVFAVPGDDAESPE